MLLRHLAATEHILQDAYIIIHLLKITIYWILISTEAAMHLEKSPANLQKQV